MSIEHPQRLFMMNCAEIPDPLDEFPVPPLRAAVGHVRARVGFEIATQEPPLGRARKATPTRDIEVDHRVGVLQAKLERAREIPVDDPLWLGDDSREASVELFVACRLPARAPIFAVEMENRQT